MTKQSTRLHTALAIIQGYNTWTIPAILSPRSPTCTQHILPSSLHIPAMNNKDYTTYLSRVLPWFRDFRVHIIDVMEDVTANKVVLHARSTAKTVVGPYANEYFIVVYLSEDGRLAERVDEFVDTAYSNKMMGKLERYYARQAKL